MIRFHSLQPSKEAFAKFHSKDSQLYGARGFDYAKRRILILDAFFPLYQKETFPDLISHLYSLEFSCNEISERIKDTAGVSITPRSVLRTLNLAGVRPRPIKEAFPLAVSRGRVKWALREHRKLKLNSKQISHRLRLEILRRDNFRCKLCGASSDTTVLEVDHIISRSSGGLNDLSNLRTLCHECNVGKRVLDKESGPVSTFISGNVL